MSIMFGAKAKPDKGLIVQKFDDGERVVNIVELENSGYGYGTTDFPITDIRYVHTTLCFLRRESLESVVKILQDTLDDWKE